MPKPFVLHLHSDDVAAGTALILAAAGAVRRASGGVVAGWDFCHLLAPLFPTERSVGQMLRAVAERLGCRCSSFRFTATPQHWEAGLVPAAGLPTEAPRRQLASPIAALAEQVQTTGALALLVSNGLRGVDSFESNPFFLPGILRVLPCTLSDELLLEDDLFGVAGFPTLILSDLVAPGALSGHELLERCGQLATRMAADLQRGPRSPG